MVGEWLAKGWPRVGHRLANGWRMVGEWLAIGWRMVGLHGWLFGWLAGWLVGSLDDWLARWMIGWLTAWLLVQPLANHWPTIRQPFANHSEKRFWKTDFVKLMLGKPILHCFHITEYEHTSYRTRCAQHREAEATSCSWETRTQIRITNSPINMSKHNCATAASSNPEQWHHLPQPFSPSRGSP